jgi:adenylate cyclase
VHGWVGDPKRIELTIIGDIVNVCARLQETAKQLDCEFLISETTFAAVRGWAQVGQEAEVEIRGRDQPLRVYEITGQRALENSNGEKGAYTVEHAIMS